MLVGKPESVMRRSADPLRVLAARCRPTDRAKVDPSVSFNPYPAKGAWIGPDSGVERCVQRVWTWHVAVERRHDRGSPVTETRVRESRIVQSARRCDPDGQGELRR